MLFLVIGIAGNKSDLFDKEQVKEKEAENYAKKSGAIFRETSACTSAGIDELFEDIGCKILGPNVGGIAKGVKLDQPEARDNAKKQRNCC